MGEKEQEARCSKCRMSKKVFCLSKDRSVLCVKHDAVVCVEKSSACALGTSIMVD